VEGVDQIVVPPPAARYRIAIAAGRAGPDRDRFKGTCISGWTDHRWGRRPSNAPCKASPS
jgi:hypothetical protein